MKVKLESIVDSYNNFNGLLNLKLPTKVAYWVNRFYNRVTPLVETFKDEQNKLIRKFGEAIMDENKKISKYEVKEGENKEKYLKAIDELVQKEVELDFDTIPISALEKMPIEAKFLIDYVFTEKSNHPAFKKGAE